MGQEVGEVVAFNVAAGTSFVLSLNTVEGLKSDGSGFTMLDSPLPSYLVSPPYPLFSGAVSVFLTLMSRGRW